MLGTFWQDLKHGARMLRKNPGFSFVAMASIAIGVGANAAMFSLADTLVLRPLTVPRANEIVTVAAVVPKSGFSSLLIEVVGGMGAMGLALSIVGLYGLVAYAVNRRTREIGIRMAVGAQSGAVVRMVMRHGLLLAGGGTLLGVLASAATDGLLRRAFPFPNVANVDIVTYALVVPTLLAVTLLAAYIPARRAARIDPLRALRQD